MEPVDGSGDRPARRGLYEVIAAATHGYSVVPKRRGDKRPDGTWKRWETQRRTVDQVRDLFTPGRYDGYGIILGAISGGAEMLELEGRAVTDGLIDALATELAELGHPDLLNRITWGYSDATPKGGVHLIYRCPTVRPNTKLAVDTDGEVLIETRGEGGFVVCAPSVGHPDLADGRWERLAGGWDSVTTITAAEHAALFAAARRLDHTTHQNTRPERDAPPDAPLRPGDDFNDRGDWLADVLEPAGWTHSHTTNNIIHVTRPGKTTGTSATIGGTRTPDRLYVWTSNAPPLEPGPRTYTKFDAYIALHHGGDIHAATRALAAAGYGTPRPSQHPPSPPTTAQSATTTPAPEPPPTSSWAPRDLAPLLDGTHQPITTLWLTRSDGPAIIYPGRIHSFHGEAESLKTWAAYCATAEAIQAGRTVIWIDLEDSDETAIARLQALGLTADQILTSFAYLRPDEPLTDHLIADQLVAQLDPAVVIIDSFNELLALQGLDPYNSVEITKAHQLIRRFTRNGAAAIIIDHVTKDQNTRGRWAIGSERKLSGLDGAAYTYETRAAFGHGRHGIARITCTKDRPGRVRQHAHQGRVVGELHLHSQADDGQITWTIDPLPDTPTGGFRPTTLMDHVATLLAGHPEGLSGRQVRQLTPGRTEDVIVALEHLILEGYVQRSNGPRRAILHKLIRPFIDTTDNDQDAEETA